MIVVERFASARLARNVYGLPTTRDLVVYLPPSYATSNRRYPVSVLLHGFSSRATNWPLPTALTFGGLRTPAQDLFDDAIAKGSAREMIVVMPDGWSRYGCSMWVDSAANGEFEQYVVRDVVEHVDRTYRTLPQRESRGVFGLSAGGFGTWHLGSRNPSVFGAMAMISSSAFFELTRRPWFVRLYDRTYPRAPDGPLAGDIGSWFCYALAAAYSPNLANPPHFVDFPVEFPTGDLVLDVWAKWRAFDPVESWPGRLDALRGLRGLLIDCGYKDDLDYYWGNRMLSSRLAGAGIGHEFQEHDGNHTNRMFERVQRAYSWLSERLSSS